MGGGFWGCQNKGERAGSSRLGAPKQEERNEEKKKRMKERKKKRVEEKSRKICVVIPLLVTHFTPHYVIKKIINVIIIQ